MAVEPFWLTPDKVIAIHARQLAHHGGLAGIKSQALIESAVAAPRNLFLYEAQDDILALAIKLCFAIVKNHPFVDGNKRTAAFAMIEFLTFNGVELQIPDDDASAPLLGQWIERLAASEYDEVRLYERLRHFVSLAD